MALELSKQRFKSFEDVEKRVDEWITAKDKEFFRYDIRALRERWSRPRLATEIILISVLIF